MALSERERGQKKEIFFFIGEVVFLLMSFGIKRTERLFNSCWLLLNTRRKRRESRREVDISHHLPHGENVGCDKRSSVKAMWYYVDHQE